MFHIGQNMSNIAGLVWKADFEHFFFANILGFGAYFENLIFVLKPWVRAGWFEYLEPCNPNFFFFVKLPYNLQTQLNFSWLE